jgi:hypothetical protein
MMKCALFLASAGVFVGLATISHTAAAEPRSYALTGFTGVSAASGISVTLLEGPYSVTVETEGKPFDEITLKVNKGILEITRKTRFSIMPRPAGDFMVRVQSPALSSLSASSGSEINGTDLRLGDMTLVASSGASIALTGTCSNLQATASSGAQFTGDQLACRSVRTEASSGSEITVRASEAAAANASSGASIRIMGGPSRLNMSSSSGGSVTSGSER